MKKQRFGWRLKQLLVIPDQGVRVTLVRGTHQLSFIASNFGVGRRREAAALAKFTAQSGWGSVKDLFDHFLALPIGYDGIILL
jgi:hypothetical protein